METRTFVRWLAWVALFGCGLAQADPHQDWLEFKKDLAQYAGGPSGYYAIQDMKELQPGESLFLTGEPLEKARWSKTPAAKFIAQLDYRDQQALLSAPGLQETDVLKAPDRQIILPNGLIVRVSFLQKTALKAWLYNPQLLVQRKFKSLDFFPYDAKGVVTGKFERNPEPTPVTYLDSREHQGTMYVVGKLHVTLGGKPHELKAFSYSNNWSEIDAVLLLLKDRTSNKTTYGGGRVVDVSFPKGAPPDTLTANLNTAYSFLCAHSDFYNCPLVLASFVDVPLEYGEKYPPLRGP